MLKEIEVIAELLSEKPLISDLAEGWLFSQARATPWFQGYTILAFRPKGPTVQLPAFFNNNEHLDRIRVYPTYNASVTCA